MKRYIKLKEITVKLSEKAEKSFDEIMYSLPKNPDGTGMCTQSQAISYALECVALFEELIGSDIPTFLDGHKRCGGEIMTVEEYDKLIEDNPPLMNFGGHDSY